MNELRKLRALGAADRRLLALCLLATPCIVLAVKALGFRRTRSLLQLWPRPSARGGPKPGAESATRAETIARLAGIASARSPLRSSCLPRSLLVWWLLRREGIESTLRIGVLREGGAFGAHAWVEHDGRPVGDDGLSRRYAPFEGDFGSIARHVS